MQLETLCDLLIRKHPRSYVLRVVLSENDICVGILWKIILIIMSAWLYL